VKENETKQVQSSARPILTAFTEGVSVDELSILYDFIFDWIGGHLVSSGKDIDSFATGIFVEIVRCERREIFDGHARYNIIF